MGYLCRAVLVILATRLSSIKERELNKVPNPSAGLKPSAKRIKLFRNEVQEAEMAEHFSPWG